MEQKLEDSKILIIWSWGFSNQKIAGKSVWGISIFMKQLGWLGFSYT